MITLTNVRMVHSGTVHLPCPHGPQWYCTPPLSVQVHYNSFKVSILDFDEGEEEGGGANMNGSDDEEAIEG